MKVKILGPGDSFYHSFMIKSRIDNVKPDEILQTLFEGCKNEDAPDWGNSLYTSQNINVALGYINQEKEYEL